MIRLRPILAALSALVALAPTGEAAAQRYPAFGEPVPERLVRALSSAARDNLGKARLPNGDPVPKETPEQRAEPLVPDWFAREIVERGKVSAFADWCGLDWRTRSLAPFMGHVRRAGDWQPRQIAFASLLHGVAKGLFGDTLKKRGDCPETLEKRIDAHLSKLLTPRR